MKLRKLEHKDAKLMEEWMTDPKVNVWFRFDSNQVSIKTITSFISNHQNTDGINYHFAIANEADEYLGTVSLKNVDTVNRNAEYAIVLRRGAQGIGAGRFATYEILTYAFENLHLERVYLNVLVENFAAIRFYEKFGFSAEGVFTDHIYVKGAFRSLKWFRMLKDEFYSLNAKKIKTIDEVKMINIQPQGDERGYLVAVEAGQAIPFKIKRIFYLYGMDGSAIRGKHANRNSEFVMICLAGSCTVKVIDTAGAQTILKLDNPCQGVYIPNMTWKEMFDFSIDCVLMVIANTHYDSSEYIRNVDEFLMMGK